MENAVQKNELLYRGIKRSRRDALTKDNKPTSALFKDAEPNTAGISVDRDGGRDEEAIREAFKARWGGRLKGLARVNSYVCFENEMVVIPKPSSGNIFHAEIFDDENERPISLLHELILADNAKVVFLDPDVDWIDN